MRGKSKLKKRTASPDPKYNSVLIAKFINQVMRGGKKQLAQKIVYAALEKASQTAKKEPLEVFELAVKNVSPLLEVVSRRIGGANYQVPVEVKQPRRTALAMRWIVGAARERKGKAMAEKLADELAAALHNEGAAVAKRDQVHRMAEANRAFAHFARFY